MTAQQQKEYWLKFHRFQMRYELMYTPQINKVLKNQVQQYITHKNLMEVRSSELYLLLLDLYKTTGAVWARHSHHELRQRTVTQKHMETKQGGQMGFSERIVSFMQQYFGIDLLNDAENITQTTIRLISEVLSESALEGWSFDEIVKRLISPGFTAKRARLIARTETVNAANAGSMISAKLANAQSKMWISARDNRVRLHHKEVNQTVIPINDKFTVGGFFMDHPGDKAGGAGNCCNCRCAVGFIP